MRKALGIRPRYARGQAALGTFLGMAGQPAEAVTCLQRAAELEPGSAEGHCNLGKVWQGLNALSAAEDAYRHALKIDPGHALAQLNLGKVLTEQAQTTEGLALYRAATPHLADPTLHSSLPMLLNFVDNASDTEVYKAHRAFDRQFAAPLKPPARLQLTLQGFPQAIRSVLQSHAGLAAGPAPGQNVPGKPPPSSNRFCPVM